MCFCMQFFWINEEISHQPLTTCLRVGNGAHTELQFARFTFKLCRPLGLQPQSLLSEVW